MRCDMCPLCPIAEDDACPIADDPKYGIEHEYGMSGCRHTYNWAKKKSDEYADYLGKMGEEMARMMESDKKA